MEQVCNTQHTTGSEIICLEGNGIRPSHKGAGWSVGGGDVHIELSRSALRMLSHEKMSEKRLKYILLEHHPNDSRLRIIEDDICQTLSQRMGTGGG